MNISSLAVKRPVTVIMITLIVAILGAISLTKLPIDLLPEIEVPVVIVSTTYSGVGSQEIENLISKPLENSVSTASNLKNLKSVSSEGSSLIIAEFVNGTDMNFAALEMREKVDFVKRFLPTDADAPMVIKIDPNAMPIIQLALTNGDDLAKLQTLGEETIKPRLERLSGVASVNVAGGYETQVEVVVNQEKLRGYGLTIDYLSQILRAENLNLPGGEINKGNQKLTLRTVGEFRSLEEIKNLPVPLPLGGTVYLNNIADVTTGYKEVTSIAKTNGMRSISVSIQKQSGSNTVAVANHIHSEIVNLKHEYPNISIEVVTDQSTYIKDSINNVVKNAILGAALAVIILYLFLRNIRTTFIIATAIPVSIIATFILMYFNGITLNLMTLGGLALGVGMLVDNAIVVLENIYRFRQEGYSKTEAAIKGAKEVAMSVTASTLTTIAVFLPIVFVDGITSIIFGELALTVSMSLIASLAVSLTLVPMLSSKLLKVDDMQGKKHHGRFRFFDFLYDTFDKVLLGLERIYKKLLNGALNHRITTVVIALTIFTVSMASITTVGTEFFPSMDEGQFTVKITLPQGARLEDTNEIVTEIEGSLETIDEVKTIFSNIGSSGAGMPGLNSRTNEASIDIALVDLKSRSRQTAEVADEVRKLVRDIPGAEISVEISSNSMGFGGSAPVSITVKGDSLDVLKKIGDDIKGIVESVEGTREVKNSLEEGIPEIQIKINRETASMYGLTAAQIASSVKGTISGQTATKYKIDGEEIDIIVKGDPMLKKSVSNLGQTAISSPMGISVPLNQIAEISINRGPVTINREGQVRTIDVTSQILGRDLGSIVNDIESKLNHYNMPEGYRYEMGGDNKEMVDAFKGLLLALILAVVLVYMILASQFESLLHPFTIMLSVPLALAGSALGLFITGRTLSVPAFIGIIMLSGIVVNNAIVLVDYINTRRASGEERREAITNAGPIRLRPILMTTLTTVLGLLPLALGIGEGSESQAPMATVVIGGLLLSTLLTLVFIPVMYTFFDDLASFIKRKIFKRKEISNA